MRRPFVVVTLACASAACGPSQSPECARYVACAAAVDDELGTQTQTAAYDEGGACWSGSAEAAASCTAECERILESLAAGYPDLDECRTE